VRAPTRAGWALLAGALGLAVVVAGCGSNGGGANDNANGETAHTEPLSTAATGTATTAASLADAKVQLTPIAEVRAPVAMAPRPATNDLYVAEQAGRVRRITIDRSEEEPAYDLQSQPVLDITDDVRAQGEQGLLGLTFSPDGSRIYVDYTDNDGNTHIVEYRMSGHDVDTDTRRELLMIDQPFPNHNGGQLAFGPDGFLYIGMGDGGGQGDPNGRAQNTDELLGKILRIDPTLPSRDKPYGIPAGNPFATGGGRPEIWIYGVRNPWRFSFDTATNDLWVADVGQNKIEEIDWLPASNEGAGRGANLGWSIKEGDTTFHDGTDPGNLVDPVFEYSHEGQNCSISGGYVYRGRDIPALQGAYLFGDYCTADIRALVLQDGAVADERELGVSVASNSLSSFGQDLTGEVYVLSTDGTVYRIEPADT
jgi:glucose/arabinose dehydrogenase